MFGNIIEFVTGTAQSVAQPQNQTAGLLPRIASSVGRKVDQLLGLDEQTTNPQAVAVDNTSNRQNVIETDESGSQSLPYRLQPDYYTSDFQQAQLSSVLPTINAVRQIGRNVVPFVKRNLLPIAATGGASVTMLNDLYEQQGLCSPNKGGKPYSVSKVTGCITVTRKQQRALKELVMTMGIDRAAAAIGLDPSQVGLLLVKKFPPRSRGISGASMKTTRRTIRQLTRYAHDLDDFCKRPTPTRRRRTK